jgi:hypothetical protein
LSRLIWIAFVEKKPMKFGENNGMGHGILAADGQPNVGLAIHGEAKGICLTTEAQCGKAATKRAETRKAESEKAEMQRLWQKMLRI